MCYIFAQCIQVVGSLHNQCATKDFSRVLYSDEFADGLIFTLKSSRPIRPFDFL